MAAGEMDVHEACVHDPAVEKARMVLAYGSISGLNWDLIPCNCMIIIHVWCTNQVHLART